MKLFKRTDIIGKIYILIIAFIVVIATITIISRYRNSNSQNEIIENKVEQVEENNVVELKESDIATNNIETDANKIMQVNVSENEKTEEKINNSGNSKIANSEKKQTQVKENKNTKQEIHQETKEETTQIIKTETHQEVKEETKEIIKEETKDTKPEETKENNQLKEEPKVELDFSKYDRYYPALNGGYTCFKKNSDEIEKLRRLLEDAIKEFGYTNVKLVEDSSIISNRYFTANKTNAQNAVYNSEDFAIHYYAETEYGLTANGEESVFQVRSYTKITGQ